MTAVSNKKSQQGGIGNISGRVKHFSDSAAAAGKPDITGGVLRRSQDGIIGWYPTRSRPLTIIRRIPAEGMSGPRLQEARDHESQYDNDRGNDSERRKEERAAIAHKRYHDHSSSLHSADGQARLEVPAGIQEEHHQRDGDNHRRSRELAPGSMVRLLQTIQNQDQS